MNESSGALKISRILHAGYVFECDETQIAFDPIFENPFSRNCYAFPDVRFDHEQISKLNFAAVFISHYHEDHCSLESLNLLPRETPLYVYCLFEELFDLIRELGFTQVFTLKIDEAIRVGAIEVIPRRALDVDVDSIFQIRAGGANVLNVVDSWIDTDTMAELAFSAPWDLVLWPFQTMREIEVLAPTRAARAPTELPPEWLEQLKILKPRYIVPSSCQFVQESWSWYNHAFFPISYRQFASEIAAALPETRVIRLNPSVSVRLEQGTLSDSSPLTWVLPLGEQEVDYDFQRDLVPPPTSEVARRFAPLLTDQAERVHDYCVRGLLEKFRSMDPAEDPYFQKCRHWRLSLYDHEGSPEHFHYRLRGAKIDFLGTEDGTASCQEEVEPLAWTTEVPISKIYAALELGESLTSMYMRINDVTFAPEIEEEIHLAEIVDDPLIRCLFNGVFGAYQISQVKRLLLKREDHRE